ncbi:MAG: outer membrane protein assembly factor BamA [Candidatus Cloacimonadota bacterium]|nr:MAG: outer membrane protein assembly factor BamA [Candidatus Cloacimonadota bacterium]
MNRFLIFVILVSVTVNFLLFAENNLILEINIEGNINIEKELIQSLLDFEVGEELTLEKSSKSIKNLYQLGVFEDVLIEKTELPQGISVTVRVKEFPIVESVFFKGNKIIKKSRLEEIINLKKGSYWSPFLKTEIAKKIAEEYKKKGYHLAKVNFTTKNLNGNKVEVTLQIEEGKKVFVKSIRIHGNKEIPTKKILHLMKTKKASLFRTGKFEQEKFDQDLENIISYYNKKGFIDARIVSAEKKLKEGKFYIDIYIYEGNSYKFGKIFVTGNKRFTDDIIISKFRFSPTQTFNMENFNKQLAEVASMYYEEGYIYAQIDHEFIKNNDHLDVRITINENTRAKIRKIIITGNRKTKEKVIRRHLAIFPGDYFKQSKVRKTLGNIYNMGFFEPDLRPDYKPINKNGDIDLIIHVNDKVSGTANGGVALNSEEGLVGQLSVSHNNLFGNSWQTSAKWEFGGSTQNYEFNFTNPYFLDSDVLLGFDIYHTSKEWSTYEIKTSGGSIRAGRSLSFLNYGKLVAGYSLYQKKYGILSGIDEDEISDNLKELDKQGWQKTSSVSLTISRDSRDNIFYPTAGSQFTLYTEIAGGPLMGDFNYFKQIAQVSWYTKTIWKLALRTKWRFGYVTGYNSGEVPPDEKFYLGGTGPDGIRGYPDRSIGPNEGGTREIIFSSEYGVPISGDQLVGILFFDAGNSFNNLEDYNFWKMKKGAGIGIRIRSPFGLIGFDYANNFETGKWQPHFQFGTTF